MRPGDTQVVVCEDTLGGSFGVEELKNAVRDGRGAHAKVDGDKRA